jgi:hypothetical protein
LAVAAGAIVSVAISLEWLNANDTRSDRERRREVAAAAIAGTLASYDDLGLDSFIMGHEFEAGRFDFRGAVAVNGATIPLYGVIALHCDTLSAAPECWTLLRLERDGQPVDPALLNLAARTASDAGFPAEAESPANDLARQAVLDDADDARTFEDGDGQAGGLESDADQEEVRQSLVVAPDTQPQSAAGSDSGTASTEEPGDGVAFPALHAVTSDIVNGRATPGTASAIVAKLTPGMALVLLETRGEWGRFRLAGATDGLEPVQPDPDNPGAEEFWIWLPLVAEIAGGGES